MGRINIMMQDTHTRQPQITHEALQRNWVISWGKTKREREREHKRQREADRGREREAERERQR